ncbi:hypothetical protein JL720_1118 [Aureococcus anophagefferens]|nr:hypothetical protein JL720_1118 [Aureococcus anophagefferens]
MALRFAALLLLLGARAQQPFLAQQTQPFLVVATQRTGSKLFATDHARKWAAVYNRTRDTRQNFAYGFKWMVNQGMDELWGPLLATARARARGACGSWPGAALSHLDELASHFEAMDFYRGQAAALGVETLKVVYEDVVDDAAHWFHKAWKFLTRGLDRSASTCDAKAPATGNDTMLIHKDAPRAYVSNWPSARLGGWR